MGTIFLCRITELDKVKTVRARRGQDFWSARDMLYHTCENHKCLKHIPWIRKHDSFGFTSSCCGYVWDAEPWDDSNRFHVTRRLANKTNVDWISAFG